MYQRVEGINFSRYIVYTPHNKTSEHQRDEKSVKVFPAGGKDKPGN